MRFTWIKALFHSAMMAHLIPFPLDVAKVTALGKAIAPNIYQGEFDTSCLESTLLCKPNKLTKLSGHIRTTIWYCFRIGFYKIAWRRAFYHASSRFLHPERKKHIQI